MTAAEELEQVLQVIDKDRTNIGLMWPTTIKVHIHVHVGQNDEQENE